MAAYEVLLLNTAIPQIQAAQTGDTYVVPRDIAFSTVASFAAGAEATPSIVATGDTNTGIWFPAADTVAISTGGISRLRLDSFGNLGLGVTPSAKLEIYSTNNAFNALQVRYNGSNDAMGFGIGNSNGFPYLGYNTKSQASVDAPVYERSNPAAQLRMDNGSFKFNIAPSGTAGDPISFTQAMTLDANGSLVVGGTTVVTNNGGVTATTTASGSIATSLAMRNAGTANGSGSYLNFRGVSNTGAEHDYCYLAMVADDTTAKTGSIRFSTTAGSSPVERARITSGGQLLVGPTSVPSPVANYRSLVVGGSTGGIVDIGTTSTSYGRVSADSVGLNVESLGATTTIFRTDSTERARITSGGGFVTKPSAGNESVFNEDGVDADFRVESDTNTHMLFVDAGANAVLINQTSNTNGGALSVNGTFSVCDSATGLQSSMSKIGTKQTASISTVATTIFTDVTQGMSSASAGQLLIFGDDNSGNGFMDVVAARSSGTVAVVSSSTLRGSPAARTYTMSTAALQLAMASGTYSTMVRCETLGFPF